LGILSKQAETQEVDLSQPHYSNLIQVALDALAIAAKDQLITQKNQQIAILKQQLELCGTGGAAIEQQQQWQSLQTQLRDQEAAIQQQEIHIAQLQAPFDLEVDASF
jgi:single-stranded-DNA-specific exonuclease